MPIKLACVHEFHNYKTGQAILDPFLKIGPQKIRKRDISSYVSAATQVGSAIGFLCVRVSDGTDLAATGVISPGQTQATGFISFTTNPVAATTVTLNGTVCTFVASGATGTQVNIGGTLTITLANLLTMLQASADAQLVKFYYAVVGLTLNLTAATAGT